MVDAGPASPWRPNAVYMSGWARCAGRSRRRARALLRGARYSTSAPARLRRLETRTRELRNDTLACDDARARLISTDRRPSPSSMAAPRTAVLAVRGLRVARRRPTWNASATSTASPPGRRSSTRSRSTRARRARTGTRSTTLREADFPTEAAREPGAVRRRLRHPQRVLGRARRATCATAICRPSRLSRRAGADAATRSRSSPADARDFVAAAAAGTTN